MGCKRDMAHPPSGERIDLGREVQNKPGQEPQLRQAAVTEDRCDPFGTRLVQALGNLGDVVAHAIERRAERLEFLGEMLIRLKDTIR